MRKYIPWLCHIFLFRVSRRTISFLRQSAALMKHVVQLRPDLQLNNFGTFPEQEIKLLR